MNSPQDTLRYDERTAAAYARSLLEALLDPMVKTRSAMQRTLR